MRYLIAISLLALTIVGCRHAPQATDGTVQQIWRSPSSTLQQRADAVMKLVPAGASVEEVERVLAKKGTWTRYHGLAFDVTHNRQLPNYDYWRLVYSFPGGGVSLEFAPPSSFHGGKFVRATPFQESFSLPLTNAP